jgi:putative hemolysin
MLRKTSHDFPTVSLQPLVIGLAANPEFPAQRRHPRISAQHSTNKAHALVHPTGLFYGIGSSPRRHSNLSPIYPVNCVARPSAPYTPMIPPNRREGRAAGAVNFKRVYCLMKSTTSCSNAIPDTAAPEHDGRSGCRAAYRWHTKLCDIVMSGSPVSSNQKSKGGYMPDKARRLR